MSGLQSVHVYMFLYLIDIFVNISFGIYISSGRTSHICHPYWHQITDIPGETVMNNIADKYMYFKDIGPLHTHSL